MNLYLDRYAWPQPLLPDYSRYSDTGMVVVIPSFNEPDILKAIHSLNRCDPPAAKVLVLVVVNEPENASEEVRRTNRATIEALRKAHPIWFDLEVVYLPLVQKKAGVGLARKIGMDEAVRVYEAGRREGVIICYDADCTCLPNYFTAIESFFHDRTNQLGLIRFAHELNGEHAAEIIRYELFLRYYIDALRYAGYPNAVQTLGSCIAVRSSVYQKQGGMNTRKAGEDFYFIHKVVPHGGTGEINSTCVYPSDRISDRVPFGTGHAIGKLLKAAEAPYLIYHPRTFETLRNVFNSFATIYEEQALNFSAVPESVEAFYQSTGFTKDLEKILRQSNHLQNFTKKFFTWWDGFQVLKYVHFARDHFYPNIPLEEGIDWLNQVYLGLPAVANQKERLLQLREFDVRNSFYIR